MTASQSARELARSSHSEKTPARERLRSLLPVAAPPLASLLVGAVVHAHFTMAPPEADARLYHLTASGLVGLTSNPSYGLHWAIEGVFDRGLYPAVVGAVYWLRGTLSPSSVGWLQALVMVPLTTFLIFIAGREAFSKRVALTAAWAFALWLPAQWYSLWLLSETFTNLLMALTLALLAALLNRRSRGLALASGVSLGVLSVAHTAYQFLPVVMLLALLIHFLATAREQIRLVYLVTLGVLAVQIPHMAPVAAGQLPSLGQGATGHGGGGGWTFWAASRSETGFLPVPADYDVADLSVPGQLILVGRKIDRGDIQVEPHLRAIIRRKLRAPDPLHQTLTDADYYRAGIQNLLDRPNQWPRKLEGNADRLFLLPNRLQFYRDRPLAADWRTTKWPFYERDHVTQTTWFLKPWRALSAILLGCVLSGLVFVFLRKRNHLVLFVPFLFQSVVLLAFLVEWRYVVPLWSTMFILAGAGTVGWLERRSQA